MKKFFLLFLIFITSQIKSMDPLTPDTKKLYEILKIDPNELKDKTKDERWDMIKKAYRKLALQYHPDRPGGNEEKFKQVNNAYSELGKLLEQSASPAASIGQTLKQFIEEERKKGIVLMTEAETKNNQPSEAHGLYLKAVVPFIEGIKIFGEDTSGYGLDIIGLAYFNIVNNYYKQLMYNEAVHFGKDFLGTLQNIISNITKQKSVPEKGLKQYNLPGYDAEHNYKVLLDNFAKLKNIVGLAFDEVKKEFMNNWPLLKTVFTIEKINNKNIETLKNVLKIVEDNNLKYEYTVNGASKVMLDPTEKNEYIKGYLKLADGYLKLGNKAEARKALEDGLKINNKLYSEKKISIDFKNEFERRLNAMKPKEAVSSDKDLINALIQLNSKLRILQKNIVNL